MFHQRVSSATLLSTKQRTAASLHRGLLREHRGLNTVWSHKTTLAWVHHSLTTSLRISTCCCISRKKSVGAGRETLSQLKYPATLPGKHQAIHLVRQVYGWPTFLSIALKQTCRSGSRSRTRYYLYKKILGSTMGTYRPGYL